MNPVFLFTLCTVHMWLLILSEVITTHHYFMASCIPRDEDGHYSITGRMDDVINVTGHRLGTAEVEDAMVRTSTLFLYL